MQKNQSSWCIVPLLFTWGMEKDGGRTPIAHLLLLLLQGLIFRHRNLQPETYCVYLKSLSCLLHLLLCWGRTGDNLFANSPLAEQFTGMRRGWRCQIQKCFSTRFTPNRRQLKSHFGNYILTRSPIAFRSIYTTPWDLLFFSSCAMNCKKVSKFNSVERI